MANRMSLGILAFLSIGQSASAGSLTIGAYAVADHSSCGNGNIPGTIRELDLFFASKDLPADAQQNFYWKNSRVRQNQWISSSDHASSTETKTGQDGADASLLTYIASHGGTSGGVYKALAGSRNNGGCYISTPSLELGNDSSRYTILSTCQGLKIGTGDSPNSSGENPSKTWKTAAKGLNCIYGYSNNMADADQYGVYLLAKIKDGQTPIAEAFMSASEGVSQDNIPAVLCFGSTHDDAAAYIAENKEFEAHSRSNAASAWVFRQNFEVSGHLKNARENFASSVSVAPVSINVQKVYKAILGTAVSSSTKNGSLTQYESDAGIASYDRNTNLLSIKNNISLASKSEEVPALDEAIEIANNAIQASGLNETAGSLTVSSTADDVLGGESGIQRVLKRKIRFKQALAGFQSLGQAGSVEITVGSGGVITEVSASLLRVTSATAQKVSAAKVSASAEEIEQIALRRVAESAPGGAYRVIRSRYGYDAGNFFEVKTQASAVAEVTVEATQGGFSRRYIEKVAL